MQNEEGQNMDLYIPRKCSATNRLITSKDHASVQINVGHLDELGRYTGSFTTFALCGFVRAQGDADSALDRLWQKKKAEVRQLLVLKLCFNEENSLKRFQGVKTNHVPRAKTYHENIVRTGEFKFPFYCFHCLNLLLQFCNINL
ncbi:hypothetical protein GQ457_08G004970 [Hibiscus cannabinus]